MDKREADVRGREKVAKDVREQQALLESRTQAMALRERELERVEERERDVARREKEAVMISPPMPGDAAVLLWHVLLSFVYCSVRCGCALAPCGCYMLLSVL